MFVTVSSQTGVTTQALVFTKIIQLHGDARVTDPFGTIRTNEWEAGTTSESRLTWART